MTCKYTVPQAYCKGHYRCQNSERMCFHGLTCFLQKSISWFYNFLREESLALFFKVLGLLVWITFFNWTKNAMIFFEIWAWWFIVTCMEIFLLFGNKSSSHDFCIRPSRMAVLSLLALGIWSQISESGSLLFLGEHEDLRETLSFISVCSEQLITKPHVSQVHPFLAVILKKRFLLVQKHFFSFIANSSEVSQRI